MDDDDLTLDDRFRSGDDGDGSEAIISAIRDIIDADMAMLETDPEAVLISERAEARLRAALERLTAGSTRPPLYWRRWCLKRLPRCCATGWSAIWARSLNGWSRRRYAGLCQAVAPQSNLKPATRWCSALVSLHL